MPLICSFFFKVLLLFIRRKYRTISGKHIIQKSSCLGKGGRGVEWEHGSKGSPSEPRLLTKI